MPDDVQHGAGGPKTPEGKAKVKLNAVKHGILSSEAVIRRGDLKEDAEEYETLRDALFSELQPIGFLEVTLVDKLFTVYWRERRVIRAERASVETATIGHTQRSKKARQDEDKKQRIIGTVPGVIEPRMKLEDWERYCDLAGAVYAAVSAGDLPFSDALFGNLRSLSAVPEFERLASALSLQGYRLTKPVTPEQVTAFSKQAEALLDRTFELKDAFKRQEDEGDAASVECHAIPDPEQSQRIQRYEAFLNRSFLQTLHELQHVQGVRKGNTVPPAAALDVTVEGKDGFVS